jgi:hypothetical protein
MGRLLEPQTQTPNSEPGAGSGFGAGEESEIDAGTSSGDRGAEDRAGGIRGERLPGVRTGGKSDEWGRPVAEIFRDTSPLSSTGISATELEVV